MKEKGKWSRVQIDEGRFEIDSQWKDQVWQVWKLSDNEPEIRKNLSREERVRENCERMNKKWRGGKKIILFTREYLLELKVKNGT